MEPGGRLLIRLAWDGTQIARAEIVPRRTAEASALLCGKEGQQAVRLIPLLFGLCGKAQGVAGVTALEAARGIVADGQSAAWRESLVLAEAIQESLWRVLVDLPKLAGHPPMLAEYAELRRRIAAGMAPILSAREWNEAGARVAHAPDWESLAADVRAFIAEKVLGMALDDWLAIAGSGELEGWLAGAPTPVAAGLRDLWRGEGRWGGSATTMLPAPDAMDEVLAALEADPDFQRLPAWRGIPAETGPLARLAGHPPAALWPAAEGTSIFARLLARLVETAAASKRLNAPQSGLSWLGGAAVRRGVGASWVQTARGLLIHWLRLEGGRVADYRIVAPTEWNFHPGGAYARGLAGKPAATEERARAAAELLLLALDPCVAYEVEFIHA